MESALDGQVSDEVIEAASEGIGVLGALAPQLPEDVAAIAFTQANDAFIDAMTTGFWFSVAFLAVGVAASLLLLPNRSREDQVLRIEESSPVPLATALEFEIIPGTIMEPKESEAVLT